GFTTAREQDHAAETGRLGDCDEGLDGRIGAGRGEIGVMADRGSVRARKVLGPSAGVLPVKGQGGVAAGTADVAAQRRQAGDDAPPSFAGGANDEDRICGHKKAPDEVAGDRSDRSAGLSIALQPVLCADRPELRTKRMIGGLWLCLTSIFIRPIPSIRWARSCI